MWSVISFPILAVMLIGAFTAIYFIYKGTVGRQKLSVKVERKRLPDA